MQRRRAIAATATVAVISVIAMHRIHTAANATKVARIHAGALLNNDALENS